MTQDLKSRLWECAEILRGSVVDRTDWKAYILPLLFFKRISDAWDEETADAAKLFGDADPVAFPEVHRFNVPALAGTKLLAGQRRLDPLALNTSHPSVIRPEPPRGIALSWC